VTARIPVALRQRVDLGRVIGLRQFGLDSELADAGPLDEGGDQVVGAHLGRYPGDDLLGIAPPDRLLHERVFPHEGLRQGTLRLIDDGGGIEEHPAFLAGAIEDQLLAVGGAAGEDILCAGARYARGRRRERAYHRRTDHERNSQRHPSPALDRPSCYFAISRNRAASAGGAAYTRSSNALMAMPVTGSISMFCALASSSSAGSFTAASKAARNTFTRSGGTPGGSTKGRPITCSANAISNSCLPSSLGMISIAVGMSGNAASRLMPICRITLA